MPSNLELWGDRDLALRWVRRYIPERKFAEGKRFITSLRKNAPGLFAEDMLFLNVYEDILKGWAGEDWEGVATRLSENLTKLKNGNPVGDWQMKLACAIGYNMLGWVLRKLQRYHGAIKAYNSALKYQEELHLDWWRGDTLTNLAYVYGLTGNFTLADQRCNQSLRLREQLRIKYATALSYNTQGLIHLSRLRPDLALGQCTEALKIAEKTEYPVGQMYALVALGQIHRKLGRSEDSSIRKRTKHFESAESFLQKGLELLAQRTQRGERDIDSEVEAYNELGCTFRDWGILLQSQKQDATKCFDKAEQNLRESINRATQAMIVERADGYEDLAELATARDDRAQAEQLLNQAEEIIPSEYKIVPSQDFQEIEDPINGCWLTLGKINLHRGDLQWDNDREQAIRTYVLADAYFYKYSQASEIAERTAQRTIPKVIDLTTNERQRLYQEAIKSAPPSLSNIPLLVRLRELIGEGL